MKIRLMVELDVDTDSYERVFSEAAESDGGILDWAERLVELGVTRRTGETRVNVSVTKVGLVR